MQAATVLVHDAVLAGLARLVKDLDVDAVRARNGLPPEDAVPGVAPPSMKSLWQEVVGRVAGPTAAIELGLAVPFGAFGMVDFLVASCDTVGGALATLAMHFDAVGPTRLPSFRLVEERDRVALEIRVPPQPETWVGEEFSVANTLKNLRHIASAPLEVIEIRLTREDPAAGAHARSLGEKVVFSQSTAAIVFPRHTMDLALRTTDPQLHRTMQVLAHALGLGATTPAAERAVRARLRDLLPRGEATASKVARTMGTTARTLQRRLGESGTSFRAVLDTFRFEESRRLLAAGKSLEETALAVGFSDQSAWTRAFRRWAGRAPAQWLRQHRDQPSRS